MPKGIQESSGSPCKVEDQQHFNLFLRLYFGMFARKKVGSIWIYKLKIKHVTRKDIRYAHTPHVFGHVWGELYALREQARIKTQNLLAAR